MTDTTPGITGADTAPSPSPAAQLPPAHLDPVYPYARSCEPLGSTQLIETSATELRAARDRVSRLSADGQLRTHADELYYDLLPLAREVLRLWRIVHRDTARVEQVILTLLDGHRTLRTSTQRAEVVERLYCLCITRIIEGRERCFGGHEAPPEQLSMF